MPFLPSNVERVQAVAAAEQAFTVADQQLTRYVLGGPAGGLLDLTVFLELQRTQVTAFEAYQRLLGVVQRPGGHPGR